MGGHLSHLKPEHHSNVFFASCGPVRGNFYRHVGIPYAKPPIGELRFRKPVLVDVWSEPRDCFEYGPRCPSSGMFYEKIDLKNQDVPDEANCLTLNVFRPRWQCKEYIKRPVMVFIHGGGFELCASRDYCDYSLTGTLPLKDVLVVTINYRLGALGFFSTGDETCPGNFGLWDQTLALKWVQKHIASFGGDPNNVTIFGQSAGGVSVDLLSLSPHSRDLFHKFLPMSGSAHVPFAIRTARYQLEVSLEYARNKGFTGSGSTELFEFMKNLPVEKLLERSGFEHSASGMVSFGPNLDYDFFPKPLEELRIEASNKPVMIGMAEHEGLLFAFTDPHFTTADEVLKRKIAAEFKEDVVDNPEKIRRDIFEYYMNFNRDSDEKKLVAYTGDSIFNAGVILAAKSLATHGNTVFFMYLTTAIQTISDQLEAYYRSEFQLIVLNFGTLSEKVYTMMEYMTTMFSNFAKYGNPNISGSTKWESFRASDNHKHFYITYPESEMREQFHGGRCQFLEEMNNQNNSYQEIFFGKNN
ncbi:Protein CBG18991 [Caenorhabditis briggsae]|uniref:Carboxylic ester hydrolase n=1 Tax=Caenorhabditis briggsae TaxID=6238 RepID=A8XUI6_CAEBR|nr:Protein CBG18991 [Caenorhabditis briggsae]CAP36311.2 Protein CBG18991 [Caenorhabditis briggsae]